MIESHTVTGEYTVVNEDNLVNKIPRDFKSQEYSPTGLVVERITNSTCMVNLVPPPYEMKGGYQFSPSTIDELIDSEDIREKGLHDQLDQD